MIIAIASGKGGTGKTTVSASLAAVWPRPVLAVDLDVEEPNLHLFLKPELVEAEMVRLEVPAVDEALCQGCGACADLCQFKALSLLGKRIVAFPEMCHGCGGCIRVCPTGAIGTGYRELGRVETGLGRGSIPTLSGRLRIGEAMSPPLMKQVRRRMHDRLAADPRDGLIDAPPGTSCPAMSAVQDADAILLVTEPTPFGLHDLRLAGQAFRHLGRPMGVVINRAGLGDGAVEAFCREKGLPVLARIPFRREIAEHYARGGVLADLEEAMKALFVDLASALEALAAGRTLPVGGGSRG